MGCFWLLLKPKTESVYTPTAKLDGLAEALKETFACALLVHVDVCLDVDPEMTRVFQVCKV